jgi:hypothetical protein
MTSHASTSDSICIEEHPFGEETDRFLDVARRVYRGDPSWVTPLDMDMKGRLSPKKNPFFEHAIGTAFIAVQGGLDVGRCTAQIDHEHQKKFQDGVGFFGFLDTVDDPAVVKALLDAACAWLAKHGMKKVRGPVSLSINEEWGLLIEGFDTPPSIMMPYHKPYQGALVEAAGFAKEKDLYAWRYEVGDVPERARNAHASVVAMPEVKIRSVDLGRVLPEVRTIMSIFNEAWENNWAHVSVTEAELHKTAADLKLILNPDLAFVVEIDGEPAAISIALPNLNEIIGDLDGKLFPFGMAKLLWRLKVKRPRSARLILLGIRKKFRNQKKYGRLSTAMYVEMNDRGRKAGMTWGELSWTLEDNAPVNLGIKRMGGRLCKTYRLYAKDL